jgi:branched-chain amino acid aminotransferase
MSQITSYEVIRIINRKPLFLSDHFARFENTLASVDNNIKVENIQFGNMLYKCITDNNIENGNIKVEAIYDSDSKTLEYICHEIPHHYPTDEQYKNGVPTLTFAYERQNPHNKIWNQNLRDTVDKFIADNNIFEAVYVNSHNKITEGTRSNIFFIYGDKLVSAQEKDILKGVTRKYIIDTAKRNGFVYEEKDIDLSEISSFDAAFISGTSPKILPISSINEVKYNVDNEKLRMLMQKFNEVINQNIGQ